MTNWVTIFQSRQGGLIQIAPDHAFTVSEAMFGSADTISGSGQLRPGDLAADGQVASTGVVYDLPVMGVLRR
ncbi:hypothetical protein [Micromonospora eburnea]|uniref:hypothetical protein n=1 Tax=Micromonospora eburnea TaxID=227316 RepID=UPI000B848B76|nr:hypothetical protein [Micromonospora eburnea]